MTPHLTETLFISIIAAMLLILTGLHAIAKFNAKRRNRSIAAVEPPVATGAKIIPLPRNTIKPAKERFIVEDFLSEEEII